MKKIILILTLVTITCFAGEHHDKAKELYKKGPSAASQIIAELDKEIALYPKNKEAWLLKAITQKGIGEFQESIKTLDLTSVLYSESKSLNPNIYFIKAECLYHLNKYNEAKKTLKPFSAFFMDNEKNEQKYDRFMSAINSKIENSKK